jgi:hypothetical protein
MAAGVQRAGRGGLRHASQNPRVRSHLSHAAGHNEPPAGPRPPPGPVPAILDVMDDTGTAFYVFRGDDGRNTTVAGENLEWMQDEALRRGITLDELWKVMTGQFGERIWRHLNNR